MKVTIRSLKVEDAAVSWKWRNDPAIWKLTGRNWNNVVTHEIEKKWISNVLKNNEPRFAICVGEDMEYIGNVQLTNIEECKAEFHIFIGVKNYWGKGVATKATNLLINYAFKNLKLNLIYLFVIKDNVAAVKAYEVNGFSVNEEIDDSFKMIIQNNVQ